MENTCQHTNKAIQLMLWMQLPRISLVSRIKKDIGDHEK